MFLVFFWGFLTHKRGKRDCADDVQKPCVLVWPWDCSCQKNKCVNQNVSILKPVPSVKPPLVLQGLGYYAIAQLASSAKSAMWYAHPWLFFGACLVYLLWSWSNLLEIIYRFTLCPAVDICNIDDTWESHFQVHL